VVKLEKTVVSQKK